MSENSATRRLFLKIAGVGIPLFWASSSLRANSQWPSSSALLVHWHDVNSNSLLGMTGFELPRLDNTPTFSLGETMALRDAIDATNISDPTKDAPVRCIFTALSFPCGEAVSASDVIFRVEQSTQTAALSQLTTAHFQSTVITAIVAASGSSQLNIRYGTMRARKEVISSEYGLALRSGVYAGTVFPEIQNQILDRFANAFSAYAENKLLLQERAVLFAKPCWLPR
jgi:hypothetical protein